MRLGVWGDWGGLGLTLTLTTNADCLLNEVDFPAELVDRMKVEFGTLLPEVSELPPRECLGSVSILLVEQHIGLMCWLSSRWNGIQLHQLAPPLLVVKPRVTWGCSRRWCSGCPPLRRAWPTGTFLNNPDSRVHQVALERISNRIVICYDVLAPSNVTLSAHSISMVSSIAFHAEVSLMVHITGAMLIPHLCPMHVLDSDSNRLLVLSLYSNVLPEKPWEEVDGEGWGGWGE